MSRFKISGYDVSRKDVRRLRVNIPVSESSGVKLPSELKLQRQSKETNLKTLFSIS